MEKQIAEKGARSWRVIVGAYWLIVFAIAGVFYWLLFRYLF